MVNRLQIAADQIDHKSSGNNRGNLTGNISARQGYRRGLLIMAVFAMIMIPVAQFGGDFIMRLFVQDAEVIAFGSHALKITSWFYLFLGSIYVTRGLLNGAAMYQNGSASCFSDFPDCRFLRGAAKRCKYLRLCGSSCIYGNQPF